MRLYERLKNLERSRRFLDGDPIPYYFRVIRTKLFRKILIKRQFLSHSIASVNIETFCFCNRKCYFCFFHERFPKREQGIMAETTYRKIIDDLAKIKYCGRVSPHNFGEPLLDNRLPTLMEYTKQKLPNCFIYIATNGDFLTDDLFRELIDKGVDHFYITNYDDEEKDFLKVLSEECHVHVTLRDYKFIKKYDRAGKIYNLNLPFHGPCLRPSSQLVINWKGDVTLCCNDFYGNFVMGNVNDNNLYDIWTNSNFTYYRNKLNKGQRSDISICRHCDMEGCIPW